MSEPPSGCLCLPDSLNFTSSGRQRGLTGQGDLWTRARWLREMDDGPRSPLQTRLFHPAARPLDARARILLYKNDQSAGKLSEVTLGQRSAGEDTADMQPAAVIRIQRSHKMSPCWISIFHPGLYEGTSKTPENVPLRLLFVTSLTVPFTRRQDLFDLRGGTNRWKRG